MARVKWIIRRGFDWMTGASDARMEEEEARFRKKMGFLGTHQV